jgi:hypothetical protein
MRKSGQHFVKGGLETAYPKNQTQDQSVWYDFYGIYAVHPSFLSC